MVTDVDPGSAHLGNLPIFATLDERSTPLVTVQALAGMAVTLEGVQGWRGNGCTAEDLPTSCGS